MKKVILLASIFLVIIAFKNGATTTVSKTSTVIYNADVKATADCSTAGCHACKKEASLLGKL